MDVITKKVHLLSPQPDVIVLTETQLHPGIKDAELGLFGFKIFRRDRSADIDGPAGGCVFIAI